MTIRSNGGIFGRNPTFNNVTIDGTLTVGQIVERTSATGITLDGVTLKDGNVVFAGGNGIDFSATAGAGTSELFSDYEEGRFDTVLTDTGAASTISLTRARCDYIKAGRMVHITGEVTISTITGTPSGDIQMTLPFAGAVSSQRSAKSRRYIAMYSLAGVPIGNGEGLIDSGSTTMLLQKVSNFTLTNIASNIQSATTFVLDFTYQSAS
jgi:hypothetical protein